MNKRHDSLKTFGTLLAFAACRALNIKELCRELYEVADEQLDVRSYFSVNFWRGFFLRNTEALAVECGG